MFYIESSQYSQIRSFIAKSTSEGMKVELSQSNIYIYIYIFFNVTSSDRTKIFNSRLPGTRALAFNHFITWSQNDAKDSKLYT